MIGRGTRICLDLFGPGKDKECFYIFDYLGNFEYFREHKQGIGSAVNLSTIAKVFKKRIQLIFHLQDTAFMGEEYQDWRGVLVTEVVRQKIFTGELGTKEDYERSFKDTPFGLLVRRIAKLERIAAFEAFSSFINEQNLNAN